MNSSYFNPEFIFLGIKFWRHPPANQFAGCPNPNRLKPVFRKALPSVIVIRRLSLRAVFGEAISNTMIQVC
jgi:hypothetical protein